MNQFNWTYVDDDKKRNYIGLAHSPRTGHLLIYCNGKIMYIDFKVLKTSKYSLFVGDELMEIEIERMGDKYGYSCTINKEADTPRNRARKKMMQKHWKQTALFFGSMMLLVFLLLFAMFFRGGNDKMMLTSLADSKTATTVGKVHIDEEKGVLRLMYVVNGQAYTSHEKIENLDSPVILKSGLPLMSGDEFILKYAIKNPKIVKMDDMKPSEKQMEIYLEKAVKNYLQQYPEETAAHAHCLAEVALELEDLPGLAHFYFMDVSEEDNKKHNELSFKRLIRGVPFQEKVKEQCY